MNNSLYRVLIKTVKKPALRWTNWTGWTPEQTMRQRLLRVLARERVQGGVLALYDPREGLTSAAFGCDRYDGRGRAQPDHAFRCASISKFATAAGVIRLAAERQIDLDRDVSDYLPYPVRHPGAPERPVTLRLLLAHRAGLRDGPTYQAALSADPPPATEVLKAADTFAPYLPGEGFEYSNFGAGLVGAVLEAALGRPFDDILRDAVFEPAETAATFLPQRVEGTLADAWRLLPPSGGPNYDAAARQKLVIRPMDVTRDYLTAHGGLCVTAEDLLRLALWTLDTPACQVMREPVSAFGKRDAHLSEGLGCFIYQDPNLPWPLYGHQGLAYGAVHGLFFRDAPDSEGVTGFALLTSAASEERDGVVTALNRDVARAIWA